MLFIVIIRSIIAAILGALVGYLLSKTPLVQNFIQTRKIREMERQTDVMLKVVRR